MERSTAEYAEERRERGENLRRLRAADGRGGRPHITVIPTYCRWRLLAFTLAASSLHQDSLKQKGSHKLRTCVSPQCKKDSPEPPRLSSKPSRLEGQLDENHGTAEMLQTDCRFVKI